MFRTLPSTIAVLGVRTLHSPRPKMPTAIHPIIHRLVTLILVIFLPFPHLLKRFAYRVFPSKTLHQMRPGEIHQCNIPPEQIHDQNGWQPAGYDRDADGSRRLGKIVERCHPEWKHEDRGENGEKLSQLFALPSPDDAEEEEDREEDVEGQKRHLVLAPHHGHVIVEGIEPVRMMNPSHPRLDITIAPLISRQF